MRTQASGDSDIGPVGVLASPPKEVAHMRGITMERKGIVFKFEGEVEEISVETFTQAVLGYSRLVQDGELQPLPSGRR